MSRKPMPDVLVILPGIMGSVLQKDGQDRWAVSSGAVRRAIWTLGKSIKDLALEDDSSTEDLLDDGVTAPRLIEDVHLIPGFWKIDGYTKLVSEIKDRFKVTEEQNLFKFPYDWRRDNRAAAHRLARLSRTWLEAWRKESGNQSAKLILIAHSMGGIISRYFLEVLEGWRDTKALITFGTPYRGSLKIFDFVVNGLKPGIGPISVDLSSLLRSFTSAYQLLPTFACYDPTGKFDYLHIDKAVNVPNLDLKRAAEALKFDKEIKEAVEKNKKDPEYLKDGYKLYPVIGINQPTLQSAVLKDGKVECLRSYKGEDITGDSTVPRFSATPVDVEKEANAMFSSDSHGSLQNADPVLTQIDGLLSTKDFSNFKAIREAGISLGLWIDDAYQQNEPVIIKVKTDRGYPIPLNATIRNIENENSKILTVEFDTEDEWQQAIVETLDPGTYRICVSGAKDVAPVTDLFAVF